MSFLKRVVVVLLRWEARAMLARYKPRVIAVTGSVGKTTTKDAIFAAIATNVHARKSDKSFNSEIGVPLTILGLPNAASSMIGWIINLLRGLSRVIIPERYPQWLVLEVGADRPGDIRSIASWLRPDIAIITGVPEIPVHVEFFPSIGDVIREKRALAEHVRPGGALVLNGDDPRMQPIHTDFRGLTTTYGIADTNDFYASHDLITYEDGAPVGMQFRVNHSGSSIPITVHGSLGSPRMYAACAAIAVADRVGVDAVSAAQGLDAWAPPPGRVRILKGIKGATIIDDSYNSSPAAALAALDVLINVQAKRRIAVLGDMLELGKYSADAHRAVGKRAAECCNLLATVGFRSRGIAEAALDAGMKEKNIRQYELGEAERAGKELESILKPGDLVLIKGSQGMRLEKAVLEIIAEPERAAELLVRMDAEWQNR